MSGSEEDKKLQALKNALSYKNNPEMREIMRRLDMGGLKWGDLQYYANMNAKARETTAERTAREKKQAENAAKQQAAALEYAKMMNIEKKKARHVKKNSATGKRVLQKIAKLCKWECQGEKCWAHEGKACPFIHKGQPGWNEKSAVAKPNGANGPKPKGAEGAKPKGAGAGSSRKNCRQSRRRQTRRRQN